MTRSLGYALIGLLALEVGSAAASIMTINPNSFASGQYVSHAAPGVTLSTMTLVPLGPSGYLTVYGSELSPVYAVGGAFSAIPSGTGYELWQWGANNEVVGPSFNLAGGKCLNGCVTQSNTSVQWLEVSFSDPVNYVNVLQLNNQANYTEVAAYNNMGDLVGACGGIVLDYPVSVNPCLSLDPSQFFNGQPVLNPWVHYSIQDNSDDISTLLIAGAIGGMDSEIGTIVYGTVPEPAAIGLFGLGLFGLAYGRRQRTARIRA